MSFIECLSYFSKFSIIPAIIVTIDWYYSSKTNLVFDPRANFTPNTKYTVTIGTQVQDFFGSHLKETYTFSFIVRPE
ncbi:MAG: Ig-like domain-containing protein [Bacteroidales bacterium]|nr:Ig-like domain-containing protein [Bacteroidales bacterium]